MAEGDPKLDQFDSWRNDLVVLSSPDNDTPTLYHFEKSYYSQIVRLVLDEEGVEYKSRAMDIHKDKEQISSWYMRINPNAVVPTLMHRGKPIIESKDISLFVVDDISSKGKLLPKDQDVRNRIVELLDLHFKEVDIEKMTIAQICLTNKIISRVIPKEAKAAIANFEQLKKESPELSDFADKRIKQWHDRLEIIANPEKFRNDALSPIKKLLDVVEENMKAGEFLCGSDYSMLDCVFTCLLARLCAVNLLKGILETRPKLSSWWKVVQMRPSFKSAGVKKEPISLVALVKTRASCIIL